MKRFLVFVAASILTTASIVSGCGSSSGSSDDDEPKKTKDGGSTDDPNDPDNPDDPFGTGDSGSNTRGCSADLQSVVDGDGKVVTTCPSDQGCSGGKCVPACKAAADSHGSVGCEYVVATPDFMNMIKPPCFAVFVANNWTSPARLTVTRGGTTLDATTFGRIPEAGKAESAWPTIPASGIPAGQVAVLFMSSDPKSANGPISMKCPVPAAVNAGTAVTGSGRGEAFKIVSDVPVSAYDIHPYGGQSSQLPSAELLLPTTAWGTNYVAALPKFGDYKDKSNIANGPQWAQIVGAVDGTTVTILSPVALPAGTNAPAVPANTPTKVTLNAGEFVQWQPTWSQFSSAPMEMSGAILQSDQPIAFVGGNGYLCLKSSTNVSSFGGCDSGHQMIPPVSALGSEYAVAPYATRRKDMQPEAVPYRIVGTTADTKLTYEPAVPGAPTTLGVGQMVDFEATVGFVIKSQDDQHPFYVGQMMTGAKVQGGSRPGWGAETPAQYQDLGDEEFVNVLAPAQFLSKYVFFTDPTYATTNLVIVRKKAGGKFADVNVDCLGNVAGWQPLGTDGNYETTNVDLLRSDTPVGTCANGQHVATSTGPFGVTVWGIDSYASYAYPAGGNVASINTVVVPPVVN